MTIGVESATMEKQQISQSNSLYFVIFLNKTELFTNKGDYYGTTW